MLRLHAGFLQGHSAGWHRAGPHDTGINTGKTDGMDGGQGADPLILGVPLGMCCMDGRR